MSTAADDPVLPRRTRPFVVADAVFAGKVVLLLAAVGAALGWPWQYWSPRTVALVYTASGIVPDESEAYVAGDGRFVIVTGIVGLLAGIAVWLRRERRGPVAAAGLAVGGAAGAYLTDLVGRLTSGGTTSGPIGHLIRPPVQLHATNLLVVEPLLALFVYLLCALFAPQDDLGRDEAQLGVGACRSD